jgi:hypothetical protein
MFGAAGLGVLVIAWLTVIGHTARVRILNFRPLQVRYVLHHDEPIKFGARRAWDKVGIASCA